METELNIEKERPSEEFGDESALVAALFLFCHISLLSSRNCRRAHNLTTYSALPNAVSKDFKNLSAGPWPKNLIGGNDVWQPIQGKDSARARWTIAAS